MTDYKIMQEAFEAWLKSIRGAGIHALDIDPFDAFQAGWDACTEEDISK